MTRLPAITAALAVLTASATDAQPVQLTDFAGLGADGVETVLGGLGLAEVDGVVYFPAEAPGAFASELWSYDARTGATAMAADFSGAAGSEVLEVAALGGLVYAVPTMGSDARTLQAYDPATGQARLVRQLRKPGDVGLTAVGDRLFFVDRSEDNVDEPYLYDPATDQATRVAEFAQGTGGASTQTPSLVDGTVYYFADTEAGSTVWGTDLETGASAEFAPGFSVASLPVAYSGALYAQAFPDDGSGGGLLRKSGSGAVSLQTGFPRDRAPVPVLAAPGYLLVAFDGDGNDGGTAELYRYTGSSDPALLRDPNEVIDFEGVVVRDGLAYLSATFRDGAGFSLGFEPATLDLATGALSLVADLAPGDRSGFQNGYLAVGDALYFSARTGEVAELFRLGGGAIASEPGATPLAVGAPFPNPTAGPVTLPLGRAGAVRVTAYDALGRAVAVLSDGAAGGDLGLDVGALAPGVYVLRVERPGGATTRRVVVAR